MTSGIREYMLVLIVLLASTLAGCGGGSGQSAASGATLTSISVTPSNPVMTNGTTQQFTATGTFADNTTQDVTATVVWSSSNTAVATISNAAGSQGLAGMAAAGTSVITATSGSVSGTTTLSVTAAGVPPSPVTGVSVTPGDGQVTFNWNPSLGATSYNIYWLTAAGVSKATGTKLPINSSTHAGLTNGTTYFYVVTAQNSYGESSESVEVSSTPSSLITVDIIQPLRGALTDTSFRVAVIPTSTYQVQAMKASVAGRETDLVFSITAYCRNASCLSGWVGTLSLAGVPRGEKVLSVTATDVFGNTTKASQSFLYDQIPAMSISAPLNFTVARPSVKIVATCADDDPRGCFSLKVSRDENRPDNESLIAAGQAGINQEVSLADRDGKEVRLKFVGMDYAGQVVTDYRTVFVDSSAKLVDLVSVNGDIWDVRPDRILFLDTSTGGNALKIRDLSSGTDAVVMDEAGKLPRHGFLTPKGAIFVEQSGNESTARHYDWRDGALIDLGTTPTPYTLVVKGDFAIWNEQYTLIQRNLVSGTNTTVASNAGNVANDVATNGDVVYSEVSKYQIHRYRDGVTTQLTNDILASNTHPLTDGINVIYGKDTAITLYTASGEVSLTPAQSSYTDYQVNNGWAAFTRAGADGALQVWLRSPAGELKQITQFSASSRIKALNENGDVMLVAGNRLYLSTAGAAPADIASALGKPYYLAGQWYVTIGRSLFRVAP